MPKSIFWATHKGKIRDFLNKKGNIDLMIKATKNGRPAVESLSKGLLKKFGNGIRDDTVKQNIGIMVKKIMSGCGYKKDKNGGKDRKGVIHNPANIFSKGQIYK